MSSSAANQQQSSPKRAKKLTTATTLTTKQLVSKLKARAVDLSIPNDENLYPAHDQQVDQHHSKASQAVKLAIEPLQSNEPNNNNNNNNNNCDTFQSEILERDQVLAGKRETIVDSFKGKEESEESLESKRATSSLAPKANRSSSLGVGRGEQTSVVSEDCDKLNSKLIGQETDRRVSSDKEPEETDKSGVGVNGGIVEQEDEEIAMDLKSNDVNGVCVDRRLRPDGHLESGNLNEGSNLDSRLQHETGATAAADEDAELLEACLSKPQKAVDKVEPNALGCGTNPKCASAKFNCKDLNDIENKGDVDNYETEAKDANDDDDANCHQQQLGSEEKSVVSFANDVAEEEDKIYENVATPNTVSKSTSKAAAEQQTNNLSTTIHIKTTHPQHEKANHFATSNNFPAADNHKGANNSSTQLQFTKTTPIGRQTQYNNNNNSSSSQQQVAYLYSDKRPAPKRLGYFQALLLRKWPCLALTILIMGSLVFSVLLSSLTFYLLHDAANCNQLAFGADTDLHPHAHHPHHHHHLQAASLLPHHELVLARTAESGLDTPLVETAATGGEPTDPSGRHLLTAILTQYGKGINENSTSTSFQRLPTSLVPEHYNLFIWPQIAEPAFSFNGSLEIHLKCLTNADNITLHSLDLSLDESSIEVMELNSDAMKSSERNETTISKQPTRRRRSTTSATSDTSAKLQPLKQVKVAKLSQDRQLQYSIIHLKESLVAGREYLLRLNFNGSLNDDLAGFYKIKYERLNSNETTWIAATQFQATDARRAFPCFDEPHFKATFSIKIRHWKNMTALSNMPLVSSQETSDGLWITDTFAKSQRMSTYLVAWTVTNFESRSDGNISVWTRPGFGHMAEYALKIAGKILRHYENFFGIEYPLPKMDMIALPDFNAGAMENWGLITYRETAMLYDDTTSSIVNKQRVATVVAHELAHQWFGNLVSPKWWDDLWLNEGFASFVEYIGVDHVEPSWRMLDQFVVEEIHGVLRMDSLSSSHQISIPVDNPDEISEIFDHISYGKGASIIRMMNHFLTEDVFKLGLRRYLRALKYSNAEQSDLWTHLTDAQRSIQSDKSLVSNKTSTEMVDVERVMNSWTLQTGYPLVTLTRSYSEKSDSSEKSIGKLEQVRYQPYKMMTSNNNNNNISSGLTTSLIIDKASTQRWEIPITFTWKSNEDNWKPETRMWLHQNDTGPTEIARSLDPKLKSLTNDEWVLLNVDQVGYYRVNYDLKNWHLLINQLKENHSKIIMTNRAQLLDDIFELAKSSLIDYGLAMEATKYLNKERDYIPWESAFFSFSYLEDMLQRTPIYGAWQDYYSQLLEPYYNRYKELKWTRNIGSDKSVLNVTGGHSNEIDSNDFLELNNQLNAINWACQANNQHCVKRAKDVFANWRATGQNNIIPALRHAVYCTAIEYGKRDDWDFLWKVYEREQVAVERDRILRALACTKEIWILSRYLDWTFNKTKPIRRQDGAYVFRMIAKNNYGRDIAFNFLRERWSTIKEYYGKTSFSLGGLVKSMATSMNTQVELDQLKSFYESIKTDIGTARRSFQIAIEEVESNVYWKEKNYKILESWLQKEQHLN